MIVIDMDMPKDCGKCKLLMQCKGYYYIENKLPDTCPIKCDIEDIKAELRSDANHNNLKTDYAKGYARGKAVALNIIEKHI